MLLKFLKNPGSRSVVGSSGGGRQAGRVLLALNGSEGRAGMRQLLQSPSPALLGMEYGTHWAFNDCSVILVVGWKVTGFG